MVLSQDRVQQRLLMEVFMVLSQDRAQQCLFWEVLKGLLPNRVQQYIVEQIPVLVFKALSLGRFQQRLVELGLVLVLKALSQDRVQQRFVVLVITTSSRKTRRKGWRRMKWRLFDESIDWFEHSSFRPRRLCRHHMAGSCGREWSCTFAHGEQEVHPLSFL